MKRIVIKVGSHVLTENGAVAKIRMLALVQLIVELKAHKYEVILVSSGAVAAGFTKLPLDRGFIANRQALAAIGQPLLLKMYQEKFAIFDVLCSQVLFSADVFESAKHVAHAKVAIDTLLENSVVPIINENDTVVVDEIKFGDNDNLSAMVTNLTESHLLVNLTNIDGLFDKVPHTNNDARLIKVIEKVDQKVAKYATSIPGFLGKGGMASKVKAAQKVALGGVPTIIANGLKSNILKQIFKGEEIGTLFLPEKVPISSRKQWILFTRSPKGEIVIDRGAEIAIVEHGKSLLPSGIKETRGKFSLGDSVVLISESGKQIAVGMVNYPAYDIKKIMGIKTSEIEPRLGFKYDDEVIHRDNLVLSDQMQ